MVAKHRNPSASAGRGAPSVPREHERAESDYQRLRSVYLKLASGERGNDVALAMIGADMERAHSWLQSVAGLKPRPATPVAGAALRRAARRLAAHEP